MKKILIALLLVSSFVMGQTRWLSENKVINGTFSSDVSWSKGTGWSISGGLANKTGGTASALTQTSGSGALGKTFKVTFTIINRTAGSVYAVIDGIAAGIPYTADGTYTVYAIGIYGVNSHGVYADAGFVGSIDNITAQEVLFSSPIAKAKTNFVTTPPSNLNETGLVFAYEGNQPINKTIVDISGNGNHGTLNGGVMYTGGTESGLQFDGVNDYVSVPDANSLDFGTSPFTIEADFIHVQKASGYVLFSKDAGAGQKRLLAYVGAGSTIFDFYMSDGTNTYAASYPLTDGRRYHIAISVNRTTAVLYLNGVLTSPSVTSGTVASVGDISNSIAMFIGGLTNSYLYNKTIYSLKLYNVALTAQQVKEKWNKIANKPYIIEDFSDTQVGKFPRDWTKISGTHVVATGTPKYLNCTSTGNLYFTTRDNASNCYMTYDYYTAGAWTSKAGLVSALSTAEATMDYNSTNRKLTFIMGTNDRVRNIKITRAQAQ